MVGSAEVATALEDAGEHWRLAFEAAWDSWRAGSLGIGCALADDAGHIITVGRNRVLEEPHSGPIAGTLLAHAEMDALAALGLRTAEGLTLYSTVEPCLMCSATAIAMRVVCVRYASPDPVFEGLADVLNSHPYVAERAQDREALGHPLLAAVGHVLPLANRVWSRPGVAPRTEWLEANSASWAAARALIEHGVLSRLAAADAPVEEVVSTIAPVLTAHGAV